MALYKRWQTSLQVMCLSNGTIFTWHHSQSSAMYSQCDKCNNKISLLESAGDGGLSVSGDSGSLGVGERSLFVVTNSSTGGPGGSPPLCCCVCVGWGREWGWGRPLAASGKGEACFITCCCWAVACGRPSTGIPFSDKNSSKSTYCKHNRSCTLRKTTACC
jgi:hypothetical protein